MAAFVASVGLGWARAAATALPQGVNQSSSCISSSSFTVGTSSVFSSFTPAAGYSFSRGRGRKGSGLMPDTHARTHTHTRCTHARRTNTHRAHTQTHHPPRPGPKPGALAQGWPTARGPGPGPAARRPGLGPPPAPLHPMPFGAAPSSSCFSNFTHEPAGAQGRGPTTADGVWRHVDDSLDKGMGERCCARIHPILPWPASTLAHSLSSE